MNTLLSKLTMDIEQLSVKNKIAGATAILAAFVVIFIMMVILPQRERMAELTLTLQQEEQVVKQLEDYSRKHPDLEQYVAELDAKEVQLGNLLPESARVSDVLVELDRETRTAGLELVSVKPGEMINQKGYRALPMELVVHGDFHNILDFVTKMDNLSRFTNVLSISTDLHDQILETKLIIATYILGEAPNQKKTEEPKK